MHAMLMKMNVTYHVLMSTMYYVTQYNVFTIITVLKLNSCKHISTKTVREMYTYG